MEHDSITDKQYPIEPIWLLKSVTSSLLFFPFLIALFIFLFQRFILFSFDKELGKLPFYIGLFLVFQLVFIPLQFLLFLIRRAKFHYEFGKEFITVKQGFISKERKQLHYGVVQNIVIHQDIMDRMYGLATLVIQNASGEEIDYTTQPRNQFYTGFVGNTIAITGLSKQNAELLKEALLKRIKKAPIEDIGL